MELTHKVTMLHVFLVLLLFSGCHGDINFPAEELSTGPQYDTETVEVYNSQNQGQRFAEIQSKNPYEKFVDDVLTKGVTDLGFTMHRSAKNLNLNLDNKYLVYSPVSIASALYMLMLASSGTTFTELAKTLGVSQGLNILNNSLEVHEEFGTLLKSLETTNSDNIVKFANGLFIQNETPLRQQYKDISSRVYKSDVMNLDFRGFPTLAKDTINNWTSEKTQGKIDKILLDNPSVDTKIVLVSTLYFKAEWAIPFDASLTTLSSFYPLGKSHPSNVKVQMMANGGKYPYYNDTTCEIIGLPYKGNHYTLFIIIPHHSNKDTLKQFENRLTHSLLRRLTSNMTPKDLIIAIPKMKLSSNLQLTDMLKDIGVKSLFEPRESNLGLLSGMDYLSYQSNVGTPANDNQEEQFIFSRMTDLNETSTDETSTRRKRQSGVISSVNYENSFDSLRNLLSRDKNSNPGLYVNQILHKVVVDVNEIGTEAAAATAAKIDKSSRHVVKVNVPFLFFIQHEESKLVLFWGSVNTPSPTFN